MSNFLAVFIGGGLGSLCRYGIILYFLQYKFSFPYATLVANALSCMALGFVSILIVQNSNQADSFLKLLVVTGFCGGFSTYSTFSAETFALLQDGQWTLATFNIFGNLILCLVCIFAGIWLGRFLLA